MKSTGHLFCNISLMLDLCDVFSGLDSVTICSLLQLHVLFLYFKKKLIYLFLAALGLRCCARAFSSCGERGLLFVAVSGLLIVVACLCCRAGALGTRASVVMARGLSSCGLRALERRLSSCGARA